LDGGFNLDMTESVYRDIDIGDDRWWYGVAAVPIASIAVLLLLLFALSLYFIVGIKSQTLLLAVFGLCFTILMLTHICLPVAFYMDGNYLHEVRAEWRPNWRIFVGIGLFSIFIPLFADVTSLYYLYRRIESTSIGPNTYPPPINHLMRLKPNI
jgi:hypothetical protein